MFNIKLATILLIITSILLGVVENKSVFGIGTRIIGDQLLVKDVLQAPAPCSSCSPTIRFNYAVSEPITYIEILSEENVLAEVDFSYNNNLVSGTVTAVNSTATTPTTPTSTESTSTAFEVLITIYGFNETVLNLSSAFVLNRDQDFQGVLEPQQNDEAFENLNDDSEEYISERHDNHEYGETDINSTNDDDDDDDDDDDHEDDGDNDTDEHMDNVIELGRRQDGDYKIYETFQTSLTTTQEPGNHSVVFYYVDSNYITYVKFVIYDHYIDKSSPEPNTPLAEYSQFSPTTLKAIITDHKTTSLFVQMFLYGYQPEDLPVDYEPFLQSSQRGPLGGTAAPMSPSQRLRMLMNALQQGVTQAMPTTLKVADNDTDDDNDDGDDDDDNDNDDGDESNHKKHELPLCTSAAVSLTSNLLIMMTFVGFIGATSLWVSLFYGISSKF